jgi:hypothetical protein
MAKLVKLSLENLNSLARSNSSHTKQKMLTRDLSSSSVSSLETLLPWFQCCSLASEESFK